jgi:ABC-type lipoprotein export system ATPase subunit
VDFDLYILWWEPKEKEREKRKKKKKNSCHFIQPFFHLIPDLSCISDIKLVNYTQKLKIEAKLDYVITTNVNTF